VGRRGDAPVPLMRRKRKQSAHAATQMFCTTVMEMMEAKRLALSTIAPREGENRATTTFTVMP
jgi:hypothetical protein